MKLVPKSKIFLVEPMRNYLSDEGMDVTIKDELGYTISIDIPDRYIRGDGIQVLATYLYDRGALGAEDAATIVKNSHFGSIKKLAENWRGKVNDLIDA